MKARRIGLAAGLALTACVLLLELTQTSLGVAGHIHASPLGFVRLFGQRLEQPPVTRHPPPATRHLLLTSYTSYASGDFFFPPYPSNSDRMGLSGPMSAYTDVLRAGWYIDWNAHAAPIHPGGAEYARLIYFNVTTNSCGTAKIPASQRSQVVESITGTALIDNLRANPGALWLIGNEPDSIYNCSPIMPELYAEVYHEFYAFVKTYDPSARVAIGAIVQPSPLRLEYLDKVLNRYQALYGERLPTALWNIHLYAFPEVAGGSGAGVPPGASSPVGWTYSWTQTVDIGILAQNLRAMRQWLADRGERDKPLIITEFGQLIPDDGSYTLDSLTFTQAVSRDYLQGSITHFLAATDPLIGYPADGNRLVQLWAWYSLYDGFYGGDLLNANGSLTLAGAAFGQIAAAHFTPAVDLYPVPLITPSIPPGSRDPISLSLTVQVDNRGNTQVASVPVRFEQVDYATGQLLASNLFTAGSVLTRYAGAQPQVGAQWSMAPDTAYTFTFEIDPARTIGQARRSAQRLVYPVRGWPDPAITSFVGDFPAVFVWVEPVTSTITATIRNLGFGAVVTGYARFAAPGSPGIVYPDQDVPLPALSPDGSTVVTGTVVFLSPGSYAITATVEHAGLDLDAQNNRASLTALAARARVFLPIGLRGTP